MLVETIYGSAYCEAFLQMGIGFFNMVEEYHTDDIRNSDCVNVPEKTLDWAMPLLSQKRAAETNNHSVETKTIEL